MKINFIPIPAGRLRMGSEDGYDNERPVHTVEVDAFEMSETPVTNAQYAEFLRANPDHPQPEYWDREGLNRPEQPVVGVSWHDAQAFCRWAGFRLPTEEEWEYACRAGTSGKYSFPDGAIDDYCWHSGNSDGTTHDVRQKKPNPWGLYDMHGNVWKWTASPFQLYEPDEEVEEVEEPTVAQQILAALAELGKMVEKL